VQGEGPSTGQHCAFLRLGGCNLSCRWCDTPYTWDWTGIGDSGIAYDPRRELTAMDTGNVLEKLLAYDVPMIVISGGEPLNQQARLVPLVSELRAAGKRVEVETNGTIAPDAAIVSTGVRFNVSPKLAHSGDPFERRVVPEALRALARIPGTAFKFVCRDEGDLDEVASMVDEHGCSPVWIMPEGRTTREVQSHLGTLADAVVARGWNVTSRLHITIWGERRGV